MATINLTNYFFHRVYRTTDSPMSILGDVESGVTISDSVIISLKPGFQESADTPVVIVGNTQINHDSVGNTLYLGDDFGVVTPEQAETIKTAGGFRLVIDLSL